MAILKKPYELSIWSEELNSDGIKEERKECIIGGHDMTYLGRATKIIFKRAVKGTNTLTFELPSEFFDAAVGDYVKNEYVDYLFNEAKLKLKYKNETFEFYIKKITEKKHHNAVIYSCECSDSFIDELSRTGYEIHFSPEFNNSVDEIGNFMEVTLENSIWDYTPEYNYGDFTEYTEERFYKIPTSLLGDFKAYPIVLDSEKSDFVNKDAFYNEDGELKHYIQDDEVIITNPSTNETRILQYGDDLAREHKLFYDPYTGEGAAQSDNGHSFLSGTTVDIPSNGYIYVPYSDLRFIYGNFISDSYKSSSEPAIYGSYKHNDNNFALQPYSNDPSKLIQFIYFKEDDEVLIDEAGYIANNDCHYAITIEEWNNILKDKLSDKQELIFWSIDTETYNVPEDELFDKLYEKDNDGTIYYTKNVNVHTSITDDFNWYPVYSEGYLEEINDIEVYGARKISITDRTELNKNANRYVTVYNNKSSEYTGKYSEEEFCENNEGYRVCSSTETRIVLPTLANNLVQNGKDFTDEVGWEARIQKPEEFSMGSSQEILKVKLKQNSINTEQTGDQQDESVSNFYLEINSPSIVKTDSFELEGTTSEDVALNFGMSSKDLKIEKDKTYAVRMVTLDFDDNGKPIYKYNTDLNKLIIGQGGINTNGNYILSGYENNDTDKVIDFSEIDGIDNLKFLPLEESLSNNNLTTSIYSYYDDNDKIWKNSIEKTDKSIDNSPFLLFKSDRTITNPFIGIKVTSQPLEVLMSDAYEDNWVSNSGKGVKFIVRAKAEDGGYYLVDNVTIGINPFTEVYYDTEWVSAAKNYAGIGFSDTQDDSQHYKDILGGLDSSFNEFASVKPKRTSYYWKAKSSSSETRLFTAVAKEEGYEDSIVYALYLNDVFYGIFWLTRNDVVDESEEAESDENDEGGDISTASYDNEIQLLSAPEEKLNIFQKIGAAAQRTVNNLFRAANSVPTITYVVNPIMQSATQGYENWNNRRPFVYRFDDAYYTTVAGKKNNSFDRLSFSVFGNQNKIPESYDENARKYFSNACKFNGLFSISDIDKINPSPNPYTSKYYNLVGVSTKDFEVAFHIKSYDKKNVVTDIPGSLRNYWYCNMERMNSENVCPIICGNNITDSLTKEKIAKDLNTYRDRLHPGFHFGLGQVLKDGNKTKVVTSNYYLILKRLELEGSYIAYELVAAGPAQEIVKCQARPSDCVLISCCDNSNPNYSINEGRYYKVAKTGGQLTTQELNQLVYGVGLVVDSSDGYVGIGGGVIDNTVNFDYQSAISGESVAVVNYINNYNLYDIHFRFASEKPSIADTYVDINNIHKFIMTSVDIEKVNEEAKEKATVSTVTDIKTISNKNTLTGLDVFDKIDTVYLECLNEKQKSQEWELDSWYNIKYRMLIVLKTDFENSKDYDFLSTQNNITLHEYFALSIEDKQQYKMCFFEKDEDMWRYNSDINFTIFLNDLNRVNEFINDKTYEVQFSFVQKPNTLNLYSLEIFEAYTRGKDFLEHDYTILRPQEQIVDRDNFKNSNYFHYKYSGRDFDLTSQNNLYLPDTDIKLALVFSKDLLQSYDVTLGDTYSYNKYFIEAIKYQEGGKTLYKDTFMIKDFVDAIDSTKHTEDDIEIITNKIDLLQCKYYHPQEASYENKWYDCSYGNNSCDKECLYQKNGFCPYLFRTEKHPRRIRTLELSKSNRFNIVQEMSKVFKMYPVFYIEHDDRGKILLDNLGRMKKHIYFITERGGENKFGFRYARNLKEISRTIDSSTITTKLFVESVDSDLVPNGMCTIQQAEDNIGKNSYILDFSYYTMKNILNKEKVERDIYGIEKNDFAFLPTIDFYNTKYDNLSELIINTEKTSIELEAEITTRVEGVAAALDERQKVAKNMYQFKTKNESHNIEESKYTISDTYKNYIEKYKELATILWGNIENLFFNDSLFLYSHNGKDFEIKDYNNLELKGFTKEQIDYLIDKYCKGELFWRLMIDSFDENDFEKFPVLKNYVPPFTTWNDFREDIIDKKLYQQCGLIGQHYGIFSQVQYWKKRRQKYLNQINSLTSQFYKKYEPFIKEGTWTDNNFLTNNEYYWAAVNVLNDSCKPKVSYNITVDDLSNLPEFEDIAEFNLADLTFVEDESLLGINQSTGLPNKQKVLITEISYDLDVPTSNKITVQNYTTSFDDLFGSISAAVQSLTYNENTYKRAANFTSTKAVKKESLQGALDNGDLTLVDSNNSNIVIDDDGTAGQGLTNSTSKYKLNGQGLYFSTDGGATWNLGAGPQGINADYIKFGQIDASKIQIVDGNYIYFLWDKGGISAYRNPATSTNGLVDFARFNKYGLSLIENQKVRLRAGYEYLSNSDNLEDNGRYDTEQDLSNQNIGFYLYNDQGIPIFKTETRSNYSSDTSSDYSARLSMTGEMYITNNVLEGQDDGSVLVEKPVYEVSVGYDLEEIEIHKLTNIENPVLLTQYKIGENNRAISSEEEKTLLLKSYQSDNGNFYYVQLDSSTYEVSVLSGTVTVMMLKSKLYEIQDINNYYCYGENIKKLQESDTIKYYSFNKDYYMLFLAEEEGTELTPQEIDRQIKDFINSELPEIQTNSAGYYYKDNDNYLFLEERIYRNLLINKDDNASLKSANIGVEKEFVSFYDFSKSTNINTYETMELYKQLDALETDKEYWGNIRDTGEKITLQESGIKTESVGIFINNKRLGTSNVKPEEESKQLNGIIGRGAERVFTICLSGEDTDTQLPVIKNIFSVLKNGCAYFGGNIKNVNKSNLDLNNLDYLPDEIAIEEPSMVITNDGNIVADWEMFYDFVKTNGKISGISSQSLGEILHALDNGGGGYNGSEIPGVSVSGYYIQDPLA